MFPRRNPNLTCSLGPKYLNKSSEVQIRDYKTHVWNTEMRKDALEWVGKIVWLYLQHMFPQAYMVQH